MPARQAIVVPVGAVLVLLVLVAIGPAGALLLAGGAVLATASARAVPGLDGPVAWAAGLLAQLGLLAAGSLALSSVSPRLHGVLPHVAVLAAPLLLGVALLVVARRRGDRRLPRLPQRGGLAVVIAGIPVATAAWIASKGSAYADVWAMSGDARNHVLNMRAILWSGGLTMDNLRTSPAVFDAVAATAAGADGRTGLAAGDLMLRDAGAMATTYVVCVAAVGVLLMAALLEATPRLLARRRVGAPVGAALLVGAGAAASPLVLGTGLSDGFLTAYGALVPGLAGVVLALRCCTRPSPAAFAMLGPAVLLTLFSWTVLAVVPLAATLVVTVVLSLRWYVGARADLPDAGSSGRLRGLRRPTLGLGWLLATASSVGSALVVLVILVTQRESLRAALVLTGAATSPETRVLPLLGLLALALLLTAGRWVDRGLMLVPLAVAGAGVVVVEVLRLLPPGPLTWTYYAVKTVWLVSACLVWLAFLPVVRLAAQRASTGRAQQAARAAGCGALALAVLMGLGFTTPVAEPIEKAASGWGAPTAEVVERTAQAANDGGSFVLWGWSDPGNDRLANFWAGTTWGTDPAGASLSVNPIGWAYNATGQVTDVCSLAQVVPDLRVITRDVTLAGQLRRACPAEHPTIVVDSL